VTPPEGDDGGPGAAAEGGLSNPDRAIQTARILTVALVLGVAIYAAIAVGALASGAWTPSPEGPVPALLPWAAAAAALVWAGAPLLRSRLETPPTGASPDRVVSRWLSGQIVAMALREGPALVGITLALLAGSGAWAVGFGAAGVAALLVAWPRGEALRRHLSRRRARE
jgi:hypothetical protein